MSTETKKVEDKAENKATETKPETAKKKKGGKILFVLILTLIFGGAAGVGGWFVWRNAGYLVTDNARVTTNLFFVTANAPGTLERFNLYEERRVSANEVLGWVENAEALRAPFDGLVIDTSVVPMQTVSAMQQLAVIADTAGVHIEANIYETDLPRVYIGQEVLVSIDVFGRQEFYGVISNIGRITDAELSGHALFFNTGGTFTRVARLLPIEIVLFDDLGLEYLIGVNARVRIPLR